MSRAGCILEPEQACSLTRQSPCVQADELQANLVSQTRMTQLANADRDNALVKCGPTSCIYCLP